MTLLRMLSQQWNKRWAKAGLFRQSAIGSAAHGRSLDVVRGDSQSNRLRNALVRIPSESLKSFPVSHAPIVEPFDHGCARSEIGEIERLLSVIPASHVLDRVGLEHRLRELKCAVEAA